MPDSSLLKVSQTAYARESQISILTTPIPNDSFYIYILVIQVKYVKAGKNRAVFSLGLDRGTHGTVYEILG